MYTHTENACSWITAAKGKDWCHLTWVVGKDLIKYDSRIGIKYITL